MKTNKYSIIIWTIASIALIALTQITMPIKDNNNPTDTWNIITWYVATGEISEYTKVLISDKEWYEKRELSEFPTIKVNNPIEKIRLIADISFTDEFVNKYNYENATWYYFALMFFVWDFENWWYYNVYRKQNWTVWNSKNNDLIWAKLAYKIRDWETWYIDLDEKVPVAVDPSKRMPTYQYTYLDMKNYINSHLWQELPIWVYLSSVFEQKWRKFTKINSLKLVYVWTETDVEITQK